MSYTHDALPTSNSFRIMELLPKSEGSPISCALHTVEWPCPLQYEAISYTWGNMNDTTSIFCSGKALVVTKSLHCALTHLRLLHQPRYLWVDAICINQLNIRERSRQVKQMQKIYQRAKKVLIWLGPDNASLAKVAVDSILTISDFLCEKIGISVSDLPSIKDVYQEVVFKNRATLPVPNECSFSSTSMWKSLVWFYSHSYFTRVWVIQEVNANKERLVHCGHQTIGWDQVELVAGYIIMETAFSQTFGFTNAHCWWAAIVSTERMRQPSNWMFMLYLASNFSSTDARDAIYGLLGLIKTSINVLEPDYDKSHIEVYREYVEAALIHFQSTDVLLYATGEEAPSWIPRWNRPMLFRNPFRFGKPLPWKPAGISYPIWNIDRELNVLSLHGSVIGSVQSAALYNENCFSNAMIDTDKGKNELSPLWSGILNTLKSSSAGMPFTDNALAAMAASLSFGLDESSDPCSERLLMRNFVAYLKLVLDEETYSKFIPLEVSKESADANGHGFGKPVWDFKYPDSSIFVTNGGLIGCCICATMPGDIVCVFLGSTYPFVLRPDGEHYLLRGYAFVHGIMHGERRDADAQVMKIR